MKKVYKIVVFVPEKDAEKVMQALDKAGAGIIGNYSCCISSMKSIGRFRPEKGAKPTIGKIGQIETVSEERIETVCEIADLEKVLAAIKAAHPYEEASPDIYETMLG